MVQTYKLVEDYDPGTGQKTKSWDLPSDSNNVIKCLIYDLIGQRNHASTDPTRENAAAQLDEIKFGVSESNEISVMDGEDMLNENILLGRRPIWDAGGADDARMSLGMVDALDPFFAKSLPDYNQPYGLPGNIAGKLTVKFAADANNIDSKKLTVGIITKPKADLHGSLEGYVTHHKHTDTMAVDTAKSYAIPQPGKLLGIHTFETTSFADVTTDGAGRAQTIKSIALTRGEKVIQGPIPTTTPAILNGQDVTELTDQGHSLWSFGMQNEHGTLGVPSKEDERIPEDLKVKVVGGVADAMRLYAITLNDNLG